MKYSIQFLKSFKNLAYYNLKTQASIKEVVFIDGKEWGNILDISYLGYVNISCAGIKTYITEEQLDKLINNCMRVLKTNINKVNRSIYYDLYCLIDNDKLLGCRLYHKGDA